jgi:hypothetical protein
LQKDAPQHDAEGKTYAKDGDKRKYARWFYVRDGKAYTEVRYGQLALFADDQGNATAVEAGKTLADVGKF